MEEKKKRPVGDLISGAFVLVSLALIALILAEAW